MILILSPQGLIDALLLPLLDIKEVRHFENLGSELEGPPHAEDSGSEFRNADLKVS